MLKQYDGHILNDAYSDALKEKILAVIEAYSRFDQVGNPSIPYVAAWRENTQEIWYEYAGKGLTELFGCSKAEIPGFLRKNIVDRKIYKHDDPTHKIVSETLGQDQIIQSRHKLRVEAKIPGKLEAVYRIRLADKQIIWLKDLADIEVWQGDRICLSFGTLTVVTKEMEAEEELITTKESLRASKQEIEAMNRELLKEIGERRLIEKKLKSLNEKLHELSIVDGLTGLYNRRYFDETIEEEWKRHRRGGKPLSVILCDVDYFKLYNDHYGHQNGDSCLTGVAKILKESVKRAGEFAARYGGEEFIVLLPDTAADKAFFLSEQIRAELLQLKKEHKASFVGNSVTLSLGVAVMLPGLNTTPGELVSRADKALYQAKEQGRNQSVLWEEAKIEN